MQQRPPSRQRQAIRPVVVTIAAAALPGLGVLLLARYGIALGTWLDAQPILLAIALLATVGAALCAIALLPTHAISLIAGWLLGALLGPTVAWVAAMLGAAACFVGGRALAGRGLANSMRLSRSWGPVHKALVEASPKRAAFVIALLRLSPLAPFAATNVALAAVGARWHTFAVGSAIGLTPRIVVVALLGAGMSELDLSRPSNVGMLVAGIIATIIALLVIGRAAQRALRQATQSEPPLTPSSALELSE